MRICLGVAAGDIRVVLEDREGVLFFVLVIAINDNILIDEIVSVLRLMTIVAGM
jgi:hypothetical protein